MFVTRTVAALLLCATLALGEPGAVLSASGTVLVNGLAATSSAIMPGDNVRTGDTGFTSVTQTGSNIVLAKNTAGTFDGHKLLLHQGSASITTANGYAVQAGLVVITPQSSSARYDVSRVACRISIDAHESALTLSDHTIVPAGQTATRVEPNCDTDGTNSAPHPSSSGMSAARIGAIAGVAGGGAALAVLLRSTEPKASPSRPSR
jgi:hypothetical protein